VRRYFCVFFILFAALWAHQAHAQARCVQDGAPASSVYRCYKPLYATWSVGNALNKTFADPISALWYSYEVYIQSELEQGGDYCPSASYDYCYFYISPPSYEADFYSGANIMAKQSGSIANPYSIKGFSARADNYCFVGDDLIIDELGSGNDIIYRAMCIASSSSQKTGSATLPGSTTAAVRAKSLSPDPVDLSSQRLIDTVVDLKNTSPFPLIWSRTYDMLGKKWVFSYGMTATESLIDNLDASISLRRNDDQLVSFTGTRTSVSDPWVWTANAGPILTNPILLKISANADLSVITVLDIKKTKETYISGLLTSLTDVHGNVQNLSYDSQNRLTSVTDGVGRSLTVNYSASLATTVQISTGQLDSQGNPITAPSSYYDDPTVAVRDMSNAPVSVSDGAHTVSYTYETIYPGTSQSILLLNSVSHPDGTSLSYQYDTSGDWTNTTDENGSVYQTYQYNAGGVSSTMMGSNIAGSTNSGGGVDFYSTPSQSAFTLPAGAYIYTSYSSDGQLTSSNNPCPDCQNLNLSAATYDTEGDPVQITDFAGNIENRTYDTARGLMLSQTQASGTTVERTKNFSWDSRFRLLDQETAPVQTPMGGGVRAADFSYDDHANLLSYGIATTGPSGSGYTKTIAGSFTYNAAGQVLTSTDPNGNVSHFTYDSQGNLASATDPLSHTTTYGNYDASGNVGVVTDPNSLSTSFVYDANQDITSITRSCAGCSAQNYTIAYAPTGEVQKVTSPNGTALQYAYDTAHRETSATLLATDGSILGVRTFTQDQASELTAVTDTDAAGHLRAQKNYTYDSLGRIKAFVDQSGHTFSSPLDNQGRVTSAKDSQGKGVTAFTYDALNRRIQSTWSDGTTTTTGYGPGDEVVSQTDALGHSTTYTYDGLGNVVGVVSPDSGTTTMTHAANGNTISSTDARGNLRTTTFDALDRPLTKTGSSGATITYVYDGCANGINELCSVSDPSGTTSFTYTPLEQLASRTTILMGGTTLTVLYAYDAAGELTTITYPSGKVVSQVWTNGWISSVSVNGTALASSITHDPFGRLTGWAWNMTTPLSVLLSYDTDGRPTGDSTPAAGALPAAGQTVTYDPSWNIGSSLLAGSSTPTLDTYDAQNRLLSDSTWGSYTYDANSNRQSALGSLGPRSATFSLLSNRLATNLSSPVGVDAAGHVTSDQGWSYTYDDWGRLVGATTGAGGTTMALAVNGLGDRVGETVTTGGVPATVMFLYAPDGSILGEYNSLSGQPIEEIIWLEGRPLGSLRASGTFNVETDGRQYAC
jgi:YD repeat-containing protein